MARIDATYIQDVCDTLEEYKRWLGRKFDSAYSQTDKLKYFNKYNKVENEIEFLVNVHGCERKSKPYKLVDKLQMFENGETLRDHEELIIK